MSKKPTNAELNIRHSTVAEMILKGVSRQDIVRFGSKEWNVGDRTIDNYIAAAHTIISTSSSREIEEVKSIAIARFQDLYKKNYTIQDYRECRQVQVEINKMFGLDSPEKEKENPDQTGYLEALGKTAEEVWD